MEYATVSRRTFHHATLGSLLTFSLLETLFVSDAFGQEIQHVTGKWLNDLNELSEDLRKTKIKQTQWQSKVEALMEQVNLPDLLKFTDFEKLTADLEFRKKGERAIRRQFPQVEGLPTHLVFGHQIFALQKHRSVVPHGHDNMATAFLVLQGDFHGRHYDRLEDTSDNHMIIQPTIDRTFSVGQYSTISDHKDNVHWFKATSDTAFIFNIHVLNLDPDKKGGGRVYIDLDGTRLSGGRIKAPRIKAKDAFEKYG